MCPPLSWRARTSVRSERSWDEEDGRMDFLTLTFFLVSSCVSCWSLVLFTGLIFPPHLCPIRLISPALHLHCTSFTGLSSSSSTSLLLVFFCSFPHLSLSTCTHLPREVCLCVSLCCWLGLCRSVCSALILSYLLLSCSLRVFPCLFSVFVVQFV